MRYLILFYVSLVLSSISAQTLDSIAIKQVDSLIKISLKLTGNKEYSKALDVNATAENIALKMLGRESAEYGKGCFNRGAVFQLLKNFTEAEKWYLDALEIREKVFGKEHLEYLISLSVLANLYLSTG
jgi:tetratricopeptide (TPR) repeat protein